MNVSFSAARNALLPILLCTSALAGVSARAADPVGVGPQETVTDLSGLGLESGTDPLSSTQIAQATSPFPSFSSGGSLPNRVPLQTPASNGSASGISRNPNQNTPTDLTLAGVPLPNSNVPTIGLFPKFGASLLDDGIDLHGNIFDHFLSNPTTGNVIGQVNNLAVVAPVVDIDLNKIAGLHGAFLHGQLTIFALRVNIPHIITDAGGFLNGFQTTPAPSTTEPALSVATYEQRLLNDRLSFEIGRTNLYHYFLIPNSLDVFTSFSSTFEITGDINSPPYPVWGGRVTYHFTPKWYTQGGAFEDNFRRAVNNPQDFGVVQASGVDVIQEVGYRSEFYNAAYPANFEAGLMWDTRHGLSNIKGADVTQTRQNAAYPYAGGGVLFFEGAQVVWRGAKRPGGPPPNLSIYGSADASLDKPQPVDFDSIIGTTLTGFIPGRPSDALGFQLHYQRLSQFEANFETRLQNIFAGKGPNQQRDGFAFELIGAIQATPWLTLRPNVQAFISPDNYYDAAQKQRPRSGFEFGFLAVVPIGRLLGTSTKGF